eukprot:EG_transcript_7062
MTVINGCICQLLTLLFVVQCVADREIRERRYNPNHQPSPVQREYEPLFAKGASLDVQLFLKRDPNWTAVDFGDPSLHVWRDVVVFDSAQDQAQHTYQLEVPVDEYLAGNGSLWMHIFVAQQGTELAAADEKRIIHAVHPLVKFLPKQAAAATRHLFGDAAAEDVPAVEDVVPDVWVPHWKPTLSFALVEDFNFYRPAYLPPQLMEFIHFDFEAGHWYPVLYVNEFWQLNEHLVEVNASLLGQMLPLNISYDPLGLVKWQMLVALEQTFQQQAAMGLGGAHEEVKKMLMDTNPWLLGLTVLVTLLHTVFDFLAFKNDIQFWKGKKDMRGLSIKSIMISVATQLIVFLYLLDNETSGVILVSCGIGVLIEAWKVSKACVASVAWWGWVPVLRLEDRESYASETKEYDDIAMRYLGRALAPLFAGYVVYSLLYQKHKGWYSFVLNTLVGGIYMFGFIMMTPQLFINYKMKSVAHLPWRTFVYKALNTFIDDLFAFIIKMPTMHRLSCFRDDIVFLVYLYQRWIYPVDVSRVNEFGQRGDASGVPPPPAPQPADGTVSNAPLGPAPETLRQRHTVAAPSHSPE